jgi:hypothetical protein
MHSRSSTADSIRVVFIAHILPSITTHITKIEIYLKVFNKKPIMSSPLSFTVIAYAIMMATAPKVLTKTKHVIKPLFKPRYHRQQHRRPRKSRAVRHYKGIFENRDTPLHHH